MAELFGYAGKMLRVDLSSKSVTDFPTTDYSDRFLGGRGIGAKVYWDEVSPDTGAFDPENRLIFTTGPLAGFVGLSASRWQICGKSPRVMTTMPEFFSYCNLGGSWGAQLKFAGYDGVVIQGKSDKPVYLLIQDGTVEIRDASYLWGKGALEVRDILKEELGRTVRVAAIGPAGDNMAVMASVLADDDSSGSGGFGAVMGSKKLKAIAVRGTGKVLAANPENLLELRKYIRDLKRGAPGLYCGDFRQLSLVVGNPKLKSVACYSCIGGFCSRATYTADDGTKGKFMCAAAFIYALWAQKYYGKVEDTPFHAVKLCDQYGMDIRAIGMITEWLRRCNKAGILTDENTGVPISKLGSLEFIQTLMRKIALREGFGDVLADGVYKAAESVGGEAVAQLPYNLDRTGGFAQYSGRLYITTGLLYATEPREPTQQVHEVTFPVHEWLDWHNKLEGAPISTDVLRAIAKRFWGSELGADFSTYEGKALAAKKIQDREYAKECLIVCDFAWPIFGVKYAEEHVGDPSIESKVLNAVTGMETDEEALYQIGDRVFNLQRAIFMREGHKGRQSDSLPEFEHTAPIVFSPGDLSLLVPGKEGEVISRKGAVVDREEFEKMKGEYYQLRGWDVTSGLQTKAKLKEVGLQDIIEDLESRGLVI